MENGSIEQQYIAEVILHVVRGTALSDKAQKILHLKAFGNERTLVLSHLRRRHWRVLLAPDPESYFIIGDEPVVIHNRNNEPRSGLRFHSSWVTVPLSPMVALQGCDFPLHRQVESLDDLAIRKLNGVFTRVAFREVFCSNSEFEWQHFAGITYRSVDWMAGIPEATWWSNPT
jgi:hypothetical protein